MLLHALAGLRRHNSNAGPVKVAKPSGRKKRKLSAEGRKRIAEAMRKRWAERKKAAAGK